MPWEKTFDTDNAIDCATQVFWAKGYESASLADLLKATKINKGSFYNAFGSKKALFTSSLIKYDQERRGRVLVKLSELEDPVVAITTFFDLLLKESLNDKDCKGCFLINTALDLPNHDSDVQQIVKKGMLEIEQFFEQQINLGLTSGAIPSHVNATATAKSLLALLVGLRVLSRGVFNPDSLIAINKQAAGLLK